MQKLAILCYGKDRDAALTRLRELGAVHVVPTGPRVASGELDVARKALEQTRAALAALAPESTASPATGDAGALVDETLRLLNERKDLEQTLAATEAEHRALLPFGDFDPEQATALAAHGVHLRLYQFPAKGAQPTVPAGASLQIVDQRDGTASAVLAGPEEACLAAREVPLPARSLSACAREIAATHARLDTLSQRLAQVAAARPRLVARQTALDDDVQLLEAKAGMSDAAPVAWLTGFCPVADVPRIEAAGKLAGWAVLASAPTADDAVPTKIDSPGWVKQVHAVLAMIGICPSYTEPDVSALFLVFLALFASMLIGDAGYGLVLLAVVWLARHKFKDAPAQPFRLITTIGVGTLIWGAITGTWFAIPNLPAPLAALRIDWLTTSRNIMLLCFALGAIHITIAHAWAALRAGKSLVALAQLGWIASTWAMFFLARMMVLGDPFPGWMIPVLVVGIAWIVLFMTPLRQLKAEWFNHVMLPLSLVSNFVDVVSYLRLFAVGTAGVAVAGAFNDMAVRFAAGGGAGYVFAALIAVFGHTLNLVLCAMGVLVHGVRLNTLEFSSHLGLQWAGVAYDPLRRRSAPDTAGDATHS